MEYVLIPRTKGFVLSCDTMRGTPEEDKKVEIIDLTLVFAGNKCTRPSLPSHGVSRESLTKLAP